MSLESLQSAGSLMDLSQCGDEPNWVDMPSETWAHILSFLDGRSLIRATETCVKFNDIIECDRKILDILWLRLGMGFSDEENFIESLNVIKATQRKYKQLLIHYLEPKWFKDELFTQVLNQICPIITFVGFDSVKFGTRKDLVQTLRLFPNLRHLQLRLVEIKEEVDPQNQYLGEQVNLPNLEHLSLLEYYPWLFDVLSPSVNLKSLNSYIVKYTEHDTQPFENFLCSQKSLKKLRLGLFRQGRLFKVDRSSEIKFQLDELLLDGAFFANRDNLLKFLKTQHQVKKLHIQLSNEYEVRLDQNLFYVDTMKHILTGFPELKVLSIYQDQFKFPSFAFLHELPPNNSIESLNIDGFSTDIFAALIPVLPNIKHLNYQANIYPQSVPVSATINLMPNLESLVLEKFFLEGLKEIHLVGGKLTTFDCTARLLNADGDYEEALRVFLQRHPTLTKLRLGVVKFLANVHVSNSICEVIITNLTQLQSLNVQNFDDINSQVPYLVNNIRSLQSLEVASDQYKTLTAATFDECSFNGVGISIGK